MSYVRGTVAACHAMGMGTEKLGGAANWQRMRSALQRMGVAPGALPAQLRRPSNVTPLPPSGSDFYTLYSAMSGEAEATGNFRWNSLTEPQSRQLLLSPPNQITIDPRSYALRKALRALAKRLAPD